MKRGNILVCLGFVLIFALFSLPALASDDTNNQDFVHGIVLKVDGTRYYLAGAPDGLNGEYDIPGHSWVQLTKRKIIGKHFNTGPFGATQWWSSDAADGELLYTVTGIIDTWSMANAAAYHNKGFNHYHELITVADGTQHPSKVIWLRHAAVTSFTLDGGPRPDLAHSVEPGYDFKFPPNWNVPYMP